MKVLVIAEYERQRLKPSFFSALTAAKQLSPGNEIDLFVAGFECNDLLQVIKKINVKKIILVDDKKCEHQLAEVVADLISKVAIHYDFVIMSATTFGKNILPRAAALCDCTLIADVVQIIDPATFVRPIYAGNVLETIQTSEKIKFLTIRASAFEPTLIESDIEAEVECIKEDLISSRQDIVFISSELTEQTRPSLESARIVVSGGRALKSKENFKLIEDLADKLHAAVGATRAAVDAGFISNDFQVGQTGKIVAPQLYIAIGISGAIQHLAGMKESKVIVVINQDPDAPIFKIADYGLVGDLFQIIPALINELEKCNKTLT
ncbi:MAG: Electron transfer flavoprotein [uncultured bacterium]|nr:MAG: Electron transfer flavoprotein [uncultured bacterium]OGT16550.1 MAG: electron transfer flavoprotein subunit beta [Gammaproteobacteria bacterium RIFCSPHIGHO2_02_FULL_38_33]OGT24499.1 MAG: electron transfer flavoprotein subunit beta [Gammaproteobacteria bacterium RIFCSPHIGHO2_12_38_15]OGT68979.1 MAG: electron transfer flavoprotein subunit beta [Gammaproteobacteria bacterium RIFCSPLOWO2_02_FULL_38_11]OGT75572.1 MAG: electron transfer flavoprotein subunit beta [Gammaproteobacteria bacterium